MKLKEDEWCMTKFSQVLPCSYCGDWMEDSDRAYLDRIDKVEVTWKNCGKLNKYDFYNTTENVENENKCKRTKQTKNP